MSNIYKALINVSKEIGSVGKDSVNKTQGFAYRGIDDVMNALSPVMAKYNVIAVPEVLEMQREERTTKNGGVLIYSTLKVKYTFITDDGSSISTIVIGEGMDSGDKSTNKAMSIAFKYALFQVFCIPTKEMIDPDQESHEVQAKTKPVKVATKKQVDDLLERFKVLNQDITVIKTFYKCDDINKMPLETLERINDGLNKLEKKKESEGK